MKQIYFTSSLDSTKQKAYFYAPPVAQKYSVPLVVGLHQWSYDCDEPHNRPEYYQEAQKREWAFIYPNFRGPNNNPEACASELAQQDILDAIEFAQANAKIDSKHIYLLGASGGAMMALLMAGKYPEVWTGVTAWCPIVDLEQWYHDGLKLGNVYPDMIKACCGGTPGDSEAIDCEYQYRSPITYLHRADIVPMDINVGIHDGHEGSVPINHSLRAFNIFANPIGAGISDFDIRYMTEKQVVPERLQFAGEKVERMHEILFRRSAKNARITIFEGGHEIDHQAAFAFFDEIAMSQK